MSGIDCKCMFANIYNPFFWHQFIDGIDRNEYKRNSRSAPDLLDIDEENSRQRHYDSLRNAQSTSHGLYDYDQEEIIYDEPSDMNYHESDFQQTFSNSDDKFNLDYEKGLDEGTLHGNSRFNTNSGKTIFVLDGWNIACGRYG